MLYNTVIQRRNTCAEHGFAHKIHVFAVQNDVLHTYFYTELQYYKALFRPHIVKNRKRNADFSVFSHFGQTYWPIAVQQVRS